MGQKMNCLGLGNAPSRGPHPQLGVGEVFSSTAVHFLHAFPSVKYLKNHLGACELRSNLKSW